MNAMKRSQLNVMARDAARCFEKHGWVLPPGVLFEPTDFGMGKPNEYALVEVMLSSWPEYSERIMWGRKGWITPTHCHHKRKEDIIVRWGEVQFQVWPDSPAGSFAPTVKLPINNQMTEVRSGEPLLLKAGERITMIPTIYHVFHPTTDEAIIGEVGNAVDEQHDNFFADTTIDLFKPIEEDEPPYQPLARQD
jgi:D-lyxose ketol-isomerase